MTIPGFTAEAAIDESEVAYGLRSRSRSPGNDEALHPSRWALFYCKDIYPDGTSSGYYRCWVRV